MASKCEGSHKNGHEGTCIVKYTGLTVERRQVGHHLANQIRRKYEATQTIMATFKKLTSLEISKVSKKTGNVYLRTNTKPGNNCATKINSVLGTEKKS